MSALLMAIHICGFDLSVLSFPEMKSWQLAIGYPLFIRAEFFLERAFGAPVEHESKVLDKTLYYGKDSIRLKPTSDYTEIIIWPPRDARG